MEYNTDSIPVARRPSQARSRERFEKVIAGADKMLAESGLDGFSIPALAEQLGMTRRSIYLFFPTPYTVLNEVTRRYIDRLEAHLTQALAEVGQREVAEILARVTFSAADFQNANPVGRLLILGGAVTDRSYRAQEMNTRHLGQLARQVIQSHGYAIPHSPPDIPTIAIEIGTACFRHSYAAHGEITDAYKVESAYVMLMYINQSLGIGEPPDRTELTRFLAMTQSEQSKSVVLNATPE